ncbi:MAG: sigma-70 family RNA polymerase sigma factor [Anaerolineales bacterium]|nr:sigma-70 family RNA polymerase sigma factor [Anaerolineales bacterium]
MNSNNMSADAELVLKVAQGDRKAFLQLYDRHASRIFALALRMLGESMAAEDVTQEVFLKLWSRARTFRSDRGKLITWLLTITRHAALDRIRLEKRMPTIATPKVEGDDWDDLVNGETETEESRWRSLHFAVLDLPFEQRQAIEYAYYHGLSQSQIASHLGIPLGTVKTRMRLGMEKLRQLWLEQETGVGDRSGSPQEHV